MDRIEIRSREKSVTNFNFHSRLMMMMIYLTITLYLKRLVPVPNGEGDFYLDCQSRLSKSIGLAIFFLFAVSFDYLQTNVKFAKSIFSLIDHTPSTEKASNELKKKRYQKRKEKKKKTKIQS